MSRILIFLGTVSLLVLSATIQGQPLNKGEGHSFLKNVPSVIVDIPNKTSGPWGMPSAPAYAPGWGMPISWHYTGTPPGEAKVTLLRDGQAVKVLNPATPWGSGGKGGLLSGMPEDQYGFHLFRIQVVSTVDANYQGTCAEFVSMPRLRVDIPSVPGQPWKVGTYYIVSWLHSSGCGDTVSIKAILTSNQQAYELKAAWPIGPNVSGSMLWTVPASIPAGEYRIYVRSANGACNDRSVPFTIAH